MRVSFSTHSTEPRAKVPRYKKPSGQSDNVASPNGRGEKSGFRILYSKTYINSAMADELNLAEESAKKNHSYSQRQSSSNQASCPSRTSDGLRVPLKEGSTFRV